MSERDAADGETAPTANDGGASLDEQSRAGSDDTADVVSELAGSIRLRLERLIGNASKATLTAATGGAILIALMTAWATANIFGLAPLFAIIAGAASWRHLMKEANGYMAFGKSAYITAAITFALPLLFYIPMLFRTSDAASAYEAGAFVGSILGIIIWGVVMAFLAAVMALAGFATRRHGRKWIGRETRGGRR